jgi:hypothetical protein
MRVALFCHCEERSDEAISSLGRMDEIAAPACGRLAMTIVALYTSKVIFWNP